MACTQVVLGGWNQAGDTQNSSEFYMAEYWTCLGTLPEHYSSQALMEYNIHGGTSDIGEDALLTAEDSSLLSSNISRTHSAALKSLLELLTMVAEFDVPSPQISDWWENNGFIAQSPDAVTR
jgi:hypothetical protein